MGFLLLLALVFYLAFKNAGKAREKGRNPITWGILTVVSFFVGQFISTLFVILVFLGNSIDYEALAQPNHEAAQQRLMQQMLDLMMQNPAHYIFILLFSFGGYLLIRYIIERLPYKK